MSNLIPLIIILILLTTLIIPAMQKVGLKNPALLLAILPAWVFVTLIFELRTLTHQSVAIIESGWGFMQHLEFTWRLDGLSIIFGIIISGMGCLVLLYSHYYMAQHHQKGLFYSYLMVVMGAMLGIVLTDNLMVLFIFWEVASVVSFFLIGFYHHIQKSRQAALQALLINAFGGGALFFAVLLTGQIAGTYRISELLDLSIHLGNHPQYYLILTLLLVATITKSAQFPFHFWLPGAMVAPIPINTYLHSATMVSLGVFLLFRLHPIMGGTFMWRYVLIFLGGITMFIGAFLAMGQRDLKRVLAFSTMSTMGTMVLLIGMDIPMSLKAALLLFIIHALYKSALFMAAGVIYKSTGTQNIHRIGGMLKHLPITAVITLLAVISMAGLPPMIGSVGKELIFEAKLQITGLNWFLIPLGVSTNILMIGISITIIFELFVKRSTPKTPKVKLTERSFPAHFLVAPAILALMGLLLGISPSSLEVPVANALYYVQSRTVVINTGLWQDFNETVILSLFTVLSGFLLFVLRRPFSYRIFKIAKWLDLYHLPSQFNIFINNYISMASSSVKWLQKKHHRFYLIIFFLLFTLLISLHFFSAKLFTLKTEALIDVEVIFFLTIISATALFILFVKIPRALILSILIIGGGVTLVYFHYGANSLAIIQIIATTLLLALFTFVPHNHSKATESALKSSRWQDAFIAMIVGIFITLLVINTNIIQIDATIPNYFLLDTVEQSEELTTLNSLWIKYRWVDSLGILIILALTGRGIYALFQQKKRKENSKNREEK